MTRKFNQQLFENTFNKHKKLLTEAMQPDTTDTMISFLQKKLPKWKFEKTGKDGEVQCNVPIGAANKIYQDELNKYAIIDGISNTSYTVTKLRHDSGEHSHAPEMRVRSDEPHLELNETLSAKGIEIIDKWRGAGDRKAAVKLVDYALKKLAGLSSSDLADTKIFMDGLDKIEILLAAKKYEIALNKANVTAKKMLKDEGADFLENSNKLNKNEKTNSSRSSTYQDVIDLNPTNIAGICDETDMVQVKLDMDYKYIPSQPEKGMFGSAEDSEQGESASVNILDWRIIEVIVNPEKGSPITIDIDKVNNDQLKQLTNSVKSILTNKKLNSIEDDILDKSRSGELEEYDVEEILFPKNAIDKRNKYMENYDSDDAERQKYYSGIEKFNKRDKSRYPCPTCKRKDALSAYEKKQGYQCTRCADSEEGMFEASPSMGEPVSGINEKLKIGKKARISAGSGIDSDKIVTIVDKSKIKTDGKGVPTNVSGAYKPVNWSKEEAIQYSDGSFGTMYKNRLIPVDNMNEATPPNFPADLKNKIIKKYGKSPKAYATMWTLSKKYGKKLDEMWIGMSSKK